MTTPSPLPREGFPKRPESDFDIATARPLGPPSLPTDEDRQMADELGLLIRDIYRMHGIYTPDQKVADLIVAAGFRRSVVSTDEDAREYTPSTIEVLCRYQEWAGGSSSDEVRRAEFERWLAGFRRSVVSTPSDEVRQAIHELEREIPDAYSEGLGEPCVVLTARAARVALSVLEASAVSAPPTITDEAVTGVYVAGPQGAALRAALGGEA